MTSLWLFLAVSIGFNLVLFVPAYFLQTDKLTDISYALTFLFLTAYGFLSSTRKAVHILVALVVALWAFRLGSFLFIRIQKMKRDKRFDGMRENPLLFARFWLLQGATVAVVLLAALQVWRQQNPEITAGVVIGLITSVVGLMIEAVADQQKYQFSQNPKNKGQWIQTGLWRRSRHPNYFGEILMWLGMFIATFDQLSGVYQLVLAAMSPLYISFLLLFVSGVPLLEKSADKRWGKDKAYQAYKKATPLIIPSLK